MKTGNNTIEINDKGFDVAIIGMACRFPGAPDVAAFWHNLREGLESIEQFTEAELLATGVTPAMLANPRYIKAGAVIPGVDMFDARFFDFSPRDAAWMEPQLRLFLEQAWIALEHACHTPALFRGLIGCYAGEGMNMYALRNVYPAVQQGGSSETYQASIINDKDFLTTMTAYKLNLHGPSVTVQTACSTSLVAVHMACQSLISGECDMALAGGVTVNIPQRIGYPYEPSMILSQDGHCRPFDADASGMVSGSGVGVVVLRRLTDALEDGDVIHAVIKGSAVNNDGALKVDFTAPSVEGQAAVISEALAVAGVDADSVSYVETHGTGTALGDPVEIAALTRAFGKVRKDKCPIGSVKSNVGHLDTAAGVASLIKTVLALKHRIIPPSINFRQPNPRIAFDATPFRVAAALEPWDRGDKPLRAGVSSFGIGGTNAHCVLEEAPPSGSSGPSRPVQLVVVSAKTGSALRNAVNHLADHIQANPDLKLADIAFTLACGRHSFGHRLAVSAQTALDAAERLRNSDVPCEKTCSDTSCRCAFYLPVGSAMPESLATSLYATEPDFRTAWDACIATRATPDPVGNDRRFAFEYAFCQMLMSWGIKPEIIAGAGTGADVAACLRGEQALVQPIGSSPVVASADSIPAFLASVESAGVSIVWMPFGTSSGESVPASPGITIIQPADYAGQADAHSWLLHALASAWTLGLDIHWPSFFRHESRKRVVLPAYPFERERYWIDPPAATQAASRSAIAKNPNRLEWFYRPVWNRVPQAPQTAAIPQRWLVLGAQDELGILIQHELAARHMTVVNVRAGNQFKAHDPKHYTVAPASRQDIERLLTSLQTSELLPDNIVHAVSLDAAACSREAMENSFYSVLALVQALAAQPGTYPVRLHILTRGACEVSGLEPLHVENAMLTGLSRVIPQELPHITCRLIDVDDTDPVQTIGPLLDQLTATHAISPLAIRGSYVWSQRFERVLLNEPERSNRFVQGGVYVITGGFGVIGSILAKYLAQTLHARLVLVSRTAPAAGDSRSALLHDLQRQGSDVMAFQADAADPDQMRAAIQAVRTAWGRIDGVLHAAGAADTGLMLADLTREVCEQQFLPKIAGARAIAQALTDADNCFCLCFSSLSAILGGLTFGPYASANSFMDNFTDSMNRNGKVKWTSVNWEGWLPQSSEGQHPGSRHVLAELALSPEEGADALARILCHISHGQVAVSTADLHARMDRWLLHKDAARNKAGAANSLHARPPLQAPYEAPDGKTQTAVAEIWRELLEIDPIGVNDNYFDLGGNSLSAIQMTSRLTEVFGVEIGVPHIFNAPTVAELAAILDTVAHATPDEILKLLDEIESA